MRDVRGQKVAYTAKFLLTAPTPGWRRQQHNDRLTVRPLKHGWVGRLLTDTAGIKGRLVEATRAAIGPPMAKATSKQRPGRLLLEGGDSRDITIKRLQAQLVERTQIMVDNKLMKPPQIEEGEPSKGRPRDLRDPPRRTEKRHESHADLESKGDSKSVASSKSVTTLSLLKCRPPRNAQCQEKPRRELTREEVHTAEVHTVRWEVRPKVPHQPCQADDGPLESHECLDVPGISIKLGGSRIKVDLMSWVEMFAQLEDNIMQAKKATGTTTWGEGHSKSVKRARSITRTGRPKKRNQRWRCSFHEERGHITENYRALKVFLDQLVQDGHLNEFVDQEKTRAEEAEIRPNPRFDCGDDDTDKTTEEEDLPLGSSAEMMYYDLFKQLKLAQSDLKPSRAPLVGFNAQSHWPLGTMTLKVRAGSQELVTKFVVLDIPSSYNAIVG
ncbi:hypothetical protein Acr_20g0005530 [Actinidia rufa]|uniref:Uncharacterized protein n=1 Tax=Actinidia rufa TaxID=165716 RepID=A0A7J0GD43_9ERIC|nr:hypothetical protein Acr_20g0005530 [Actinidia rufa]